MEISTIVGLIVGIGGILLGNIIEGGHVASLAQGAAAVIVFAGTFGAVLVASSMEDVKLGLQLFKQAFSKTPDNSLQQVEEIFELARLARKEGVLAIEPKIAGIKDEFTQGVLRSITDGIQLQTVRSIWESAIAAEEERQMGGAKIWIDAGGFAPTVGIIGAVLGLIHIMGNLSDTSKLGAGIAVAFVATIYGVASANLLFLPIGSKIKKRILHQAQIKTMILEGCLEIPGSLNPQIIQQLMLSYLQPQSKKK